MTKIQQWRKTTGWQFVWDTDATNKSKRKMAAGETRRYPRQKSFQVGNKTEKTLTKLKKKKNKQSPKKKKKWKTYTNTKNHLDKKTNNNYNNNNQ